MHGKISDLVKPNRAIAEYPAHFVRRNFLASVVLQWPNRIYAIQ